MPLAPVALSQYAILTEDDVKRGGSFGSGQDQDDAIRELINQGTALIEGYLRRPLRTRGTVTEYHTPLYCPEADLLTRDYPIIAVQDVAEDVNRVYATLLDPTTDYLVTKPTGKIYRLGGGAGVIAWLRGFRSIRVRYSFGYATAADIPEDIREVAKRWVLLSYDEVQKKRRGVSSITDSAGTVTRFYSARLSDDMKAQLAPHRRQDRTQTGERDE